MYRVWLTDVEKAIDVLRSKVEIEMLGSICGNANGDFLFHISDDLTYLVKHDDFSVWKKDKDWRKKWQKVADADDDNINACMRESLGEGWW
jgi:hypothetical protein